MYQYQIRHDDPGTVSIVGRISRKDSPAFVTIPVTRELHSRLYNAIDGSMATGGAALLSWALDELERQGISLEARLQPDDTLSS